MHDQAEGLGASIVSRLAGAWMVDSEWSSPVDGGFRWWAHRLEQRNAVTNDENYFGYLRSFPEAWDGAIRFLRGEYFEGGADAGGKPGPYG